MNNVFYVSGDIDDKLFDAVADFLLEAEQDGVDVTLRICSEGGDALYGMALFDLIRGVSKAVVTTEAYGDVCSTAMLIYLAGHRRRIAPYARLMWHNAWDSPAKGKYGSDDLRRQARELSQLDNLGNLAFAERQGINVERVAEWANETKWWTADEAIEDKLAEEYTRGISK